MRRLGNRTVARSEISQQILEALGKKLNRDVSTIEIHQRLREDLGLDSLAMIELLFDVEEAFDLEIPDGDFHKLGTVGSVVQYVEEKAKSSS